MSQLRKPKQKLHSNKIRIILAEIGMSQQELSDLTIKDVSNLSKIINGKRRCISLPVAFQIAGALGKTVEEVFIYKKPNNEENSNISTQSV
jgi:transcriptional regulator with XRE-family HTH domain